MTTSEQRKQMRSAFGHPFTTKKKVMEVMDYKQYNEINKFFLGLGRIGSKYFTDEVIEKILGEVSYED